MQLRGNGSHLPVDRQGKHKYYRQGKQTDLYSIHHIRLLSNGDDGCTGKLRIAWVLPGYKQRCSFSPECPKGFGPPGNDGERLLAPGSGMPVASSIYAAFRQPGRGRGAGEHGKGLERQRVGMQVGEPVTNPINQSTQKQNNAAANQNPQGYPKLQRCYAIYCREQIDSETNTLRAARGAHLCSWPAAPVHRAARGAHLRARSPSFFSPSWPACRGSQSAASSPRSEQTAPTQRARSLALARHTVTCIELLAPSRVSTWGRVGLAVPEPARGASGSCLETAVGGAANPAKALAKINATKTPSDARGSRHLPSPRPRWAPRNLPSSNSAVASMDAAAVAVTSRPEAPVPSQRKSAHAKNRPARRRPAVAMVPAQLPRHRPGCAGAGASAATPSLRAPSPPPTPIGLTKLTSRLGTKTHQISI